MTDVETRIALGGPSIGDIRSRLIRLIPTAVDPSVDAIRNLLSHRFPSQWSEREAREAWRDVVEGRSNLWKGIPPDRKELIRGFLVSFEGEVLKRAHKNFSFRNGSIGNFFLSAAQLYVLLQLSQNTDPDLLLDSSVHFPLLSFSFLASHRVKSVRSSSSLLLH